MLQIIKNENTSQIIRGIVYSVPINFLFFTVFIVVMRVLSTKNFLLNGSAQQLALLFTSIVFGIPLLISLIMAYVQRQHHKIRLFWISLACTQLALAVIISPNFQM